MAHALSPPKPRKSGAAGTNPHTIQQAAPFCPPRVTAFLQAPVPATKFLPARRFRL